MDHRPDWPVILLPGDRFLKIYAMSDIHVDYPINMAWVKDLSNSDYRDAALILAGDVTHRLDRLETALTCLRQKFAKVFYVPGNHELWLLQSDCVNSLDKFNAILELCSSLGVHTQSARIGTGAAAVWLVPLYSWYVKPEEGESSLFLTKPGEDPTLKVWSDNYFVKWPEQEKGPADWFLDLNLESLEKTYDAPVISFSHFLPRTDLILPSPEERAAFKGPWVDPHPTFNFSRVAGDSRLDSQIRKLPARMHVYGHQHRNRYRLVEETIYVSHCLGYSRERETGFVGQALKPRLIWDNGSAA